MSRWTFIVSDKIRAKLHAMVERAPIGMLIEFREAKRTLEQNSKLWPMLTDISVQLTWHGMKYPPEDWKDFLMHQLRGGRWMPAEDGGMVPIGFRTSELSKSEFAQLIEVVYAFGARQGVEWSEPESSSEGTGAARPVKNQPALAREVVA